MRRSLRPERPPGEFPPGWTAWFAAMGARIGAVTGATAEAIVAVFLQREPAPPAPAVAQLGRWGSFTTLWRQQWQPAGRDERWMRFIAYAITTLMHVLFAVMLIILAYTHFVDTAGETSDVAVRVQFIGEGTTEEEGGGPPSPRPDTVVAPTAAQRQTQPQPQPQRPELSEAQAPQSQVEAPPLEQVQREQPQLAEETVEPPTEQLLQVTETAKPDETRFRLPPPQPRPIAAAPTPSVTVPTLRSEVEAIPLPRAPAPVRPIDRVQPQRQISVPQISEQPTDIEIPQPLPAVRARELPAAATAQAELRVPASTVEAQSLPMPPGAASAAETASASSQPSGAPNAPPAPASGTQPAAASTGAGVGPKPGTVPTPAKGDDWGDAQRNVAGQPKGGQQPGAKAGLYNADGSLRLPPGAGGAQTPSQYGNPPGSKEEHIADLDRAGTWLNRPRLGYEPTRFDKYWVPHETLLQEWVRKGIKKLSIPIPGTSKRLECVVSLLQVGGGCGMSDSEKLFDQPAEGRPAPDIPFKPELQEDQDALKKP